MPVQIVSATEKVEVQAPSNSTQEEVLARVGYMTRILHDSLRGLGLDKVLADVTEEIPDARDRLNYVVRMTEQAAQRVLNATDIALPLQAKIGADAVVLEKEWVALLADPSLKSQYDILAKKTLDYLRETTKSSTETKDLLMDIMMAQDFQDLTGQVIKKVTALAQELETQLVQVLIDFQPEVKKEKSKKSKTESLMNGPQINEVVSEDAVAGQAQVDDLLDSLGF